MEILIYLTSYALELSALSIPPNIHESYLSRWIWFGQMRILCRIKEIVENSSVPRIKLRCLDLHPIPWWLLSKSILSKITQRISSRQTRKIFDAIIDSNFSRQNEKLIQRANFLEIFNFSIKLVKNKWSIKGSFALETYLYTLSLFLCFCLCLSLKREKRIILELLSISWYDLIRESVFSR